MANTKQTSRLTKWLLQAQVALLRRQWMGPLNRSVMVITTTGRKSGRRYATPIGFARDGDELFAFNIGGKPNWYRNLLKHPEVTLEIQGSVIVARGEPVTEMDDLRRVIAIYKRERPEVFGRFFKVSAQTPTDDVVEQLDCRITFVRFRQVAQTQSLTINPRQLPDPGTAPAPRWRWYHGVAFYLFVQGAGYILGNLVSAARHVPRQSPTLWRQYFHELNQAAFAPPASLFVPVWAVNNVSAIWGLLRALNQPAGAPGRTTFLRLQALSWLDLVVWNAAYFAVRSPINGFVLTAVFLILTLASIGVALLRLQDTRVALSLATLCVWLLLATPLAWVQMRWNRDDLWQIGPWAIPDPRQVKPGTGLRGAGPGD